jgi:N-acetylglucosamine kinase-like BadF-type ATPase
VLLDKLARRFGDTSSALGMIYGAPSAAHELAAFALAVAEAAAEGDPVAGDIWRRAGALLAESAHAAARDLPGLASGPRFPAYGRAPTVTEFSWGGRLFDAGSLLLDPFRAELMRRVPDARLTAPAGHAVDGALLLAQQGLPAARPHPPTYAMELPAPA